MVTLEIFFATNSAFVQHLSVAIASILYNASSEDICNIYVMTDDLSERNINTLESLKSIKQYALEIINVDQARFVDCVPPGYIASKAAFYRYLIPEIKPTLNKALYLDCDLIVAKSLKELFSIELADNYVAGVEDYHETYVYAKSKPLLDKDEPYLNSGVLLFNCKKMREDNFTQKCFELTSTIAKKTYIMRDQDVINIVAKNKKVLIEPKYNLISAVFEKAIVTSYTEKQIQEAISDPVIIHFTGEEKPWMIAAMPINDVSYEYYKYLQLTPFYSASTKYRLLLQNRRIKEAWRKIRKNAALRVLFAVIVLPLCIIKFIGTVLFSGCQLILEFNRRTKL